MRKIFTCAALAAMITLVCHAGATTTKKSSSARKGSKSVSHSTTKKSSSTGTKSASSTGTRKGTTTASARGKKSAAAVKRTSWRNRQVSPSSDRYKEIQSALVSRGYLKEEDATGTWNQGSTDALKKFQEEQNLDATGKINSLSLIALGLGPRHDAVAAVPKAPPIPDSGQ